MDETRVVSGAANGEDELVEISIRPKKLDEYLGQTAVREQMKIYIEASRRRGEASM
jgi:holliday junction DNA helicase RuvB